jgi:2-keto-4-pentenoate hydratase/2-oxohepta-3-ene-1,7-dioic acid hydratase in catechol pathway
MKLCRFKIDDTIHIGKVVEGGVVDLTTVAGVGASMRALLTRYDELAPKLAAFKGSPKPLSEVRLLAPIDDPQKYLAIGMNYQAHANEAAAAGVPVPKSQLWFNKQVSCITGPYDPIELPKASDRMDYEAELGFVIGRRCRHVKAAEALSVVAGYLVCDDVTARDWQFRSPTFTLGKSFDTHGPIGPWITTVDEVPDPHALTMWLTVNGEERQRTSTGDMIYNIFDQIAYLSTVMTLEPGDLIATGTPSGVGIASDRFLKVGDVVRVEIEQLGAIENRVIAEA